MKYICILVLFILAYSQQTVTLKGNSNVQMYNNQTYNQKFIAQGHILSCTSNDLYSYVQTHQEFLLNSPYLIEITQISNPIQISLSTNFQFLQPELNATSCNQSSCTIEITNGCPTPSFFNYFDVISITIGSLDTFSYNVICDELQPINSFQWGLIIQIVISVIVIALTARHSNTESLDNFGFQINYVLILVVDGIMIVGATLIFLGIGVDVINIILIILCWIYGTLCIALSFIEAAFITRAKWVRKQKKFFNRLKIRVMDVIGFFLGLGILLSWWFSDKNWLISDLITIFMWVGTIKLFKFTSFKIATFSFTFTIILQLIFIILMQVVFNLSYNTELLNLFNNPFFLQIPTLNPVPNQKCSWLFISSLVYPGIVLAYLYRFDKCRSSSVYFFIFLAGYFIGSIIWTIVSVFSPFTLPFGTISEPTIIIIIILFSNRRNELPILWSGQFLDEEYKDSKEKVQQLIQIIKLQKTQSKMTFKASLLRGLRINSNISSIIPE